MAQIKRATVHAIGALDRCNRTLHKFDPVLGIAALSQQVALDETCPLLIVCEAMLDAVGHRFISENRGPFWISPQSSEKRLTVQGKGGGKRQSHTSCTSQGLSRDSSGLLRVAQDQERPGKRRQCANFVFYTEPSIGCDGLLVGSAELETPFQMEARVNESTHRPERLAHESVS